MHSTDLSEQSLSFQDYQARFRASAARRGACVSILANGGCTAAWGRAAECRLALMSGVHGDERSGPLALLEAVEGESIATLCRPGQSLWIAPLLNDDGWNARTREWRGLNLNATFMPERAPAFLAEVMEDLARRPPDVFLDLHEDDEKEFAYLFRYGEDNTGFPEDLGKVLDARLVPWSSADLQRWQGSSEIWVRQLGCRLAATLEAPPTWPMPERIRWLEKAITWTAATMPDHAKTLACRAANMGTRI